MKNYKSKLQKYEQKEITEWFPKNLYSGPQDVEAVIMGGVPRREPNPIIETGDPDGDVLGGSQDALLLGFLN